MLSVPADALKARAQALKETLDSLNLKLAFEVKAGESATGGGSLPATPIPSWTLAVTARHIPDDELCRRLRRGEPPIVARIVDEAVRLDMRTLMEGDDEIIVASLKRIGA
jgi:L-seryl-tRNA(Ser) seleniumtransferase